MPSYAPPPETDSGRELARLKLTIFTVIGLMVVALGLKAWDEHQTADETRLSLMQQDARRVAERLDTSSRLVVALLENEADLQAARATLALATPGVDVILPLEEALASDPEGRIAPAAQLAQSLLSKDQRLGLTKQGDLVFAATAPAGEPVLAFTPSRAWLPAGQGETALKLSQSAPASGYFAAGGLERDARACAPVSGQALSVCLSRRTAWLSMDDLIRILILGLLIAAPIFVIFGLMTRARRASGLAYQFSTASAQDASDLYAILRGGMTGYWEWVPQDDTITLSEAACELLECAGGCALRRNDFLDLVHADSRDAVQQILEDGRITGFVEFAFRGNKDPSRWFEFRGSVMDPTSSNGAFGGVLSDVTRRKKVEDRAKMAERRLRQAIESVQVPFALWDHRRRLAFWNESYASDFRLTDTLRVGMTYDTVEIARSGSIKVERQSEQDPATTLFNLADGRWLKMVERATPDNGLITICVDVTENIRKEEQLRAQRMKMKSTVAELERSEGRASELSRKYSEEKAKAEHAAHTKSAFLANMSHELRTPLNAINGFSEIIAHELYGPLGDERYKGYAQDILTSGQHLLDMINDILDMAKIEAGKMTINPQPIDPVDPVDAAVRMIRRKAEQKGITIFLDTQPNLPEIDADHRAIRQMVLNLVSNAIKFTDSGGTITVAVEQRGPEILIAVTDTGIGIPAEDLPRLAKPFEQVSGTRDRNYEGTGLGLALTKSFAEMHGGRMHLSSIEGEGTTVSFSLPIGAGALPADEDDITRVA